MPTPRNTDAELSLINDTAFLDELEQFEQMDEHVVDLAIEQRRTGSDAYAALEIGLPTQRSAPEDPAPAHEFVPVDEDDGDRPLESAPPGRQVPLVAAALVLAACLAAGAVTAALVSRDRLTQITVTPASR